jgi:nucleoside-diphosphate-sugar epimerase
VSDVKKLLILGCGYTGLAALRQGAARGLEVTATVRSEARRSELQGEPARILLLAPLDARIAEHVDASTHVLVCFPADAATDARVAPSLSAACSIAYVSSTGVFGERTGAIDDRTPLPDPPNERSARLLRAEAHYRAQGATVLRSAAIYGPDRGLHMRLLRGEHELPGDGSHTLSRIHVEDLAQLALAAAGVRGETFVVGDAEPAAHRDVVRFVCESYRLPMPASVPLDTVHASLRADRAIDGSRARRALGVTLRFPSYREGMAPAATGIAPRA